MSADEAMPADPLLLFAAWYSVACEQEDAPELVALATASSAARPSVRTVELQGFDACGFVFYTGSASRKGRELAENPYAALCFYWRSAGHQVRVEGRVAPAPLDGEEAELAARAASSPRQGEPIRDRGELEARIDAVRARYGDETPPLPSDWGAYRLVPDAYEFWQSRADRLHDRFRYRASTADGWEVERLFP